MHKWNRRSHQIEVPQADRRVSFGRHRLEILREFDSHSGTGRI